jgi:hypothetical protein
MEYSPSRENDNAWASQGNPHLSRGRKIHYGVKHYATGEQYSVSSVHKLLSYL